MNDDLRTIQRVLEGNADAYRLLVEIYQKPLFSMIGNILSDPNDCEDIAQETFLAAYLHLGSYDSHESKFSTWLFTIARNLCFNKAKKRKPLAMESIDPGIESGHPADGLIAGEFAAVLDRVLDSLPIEQKSAFILSEIQGLSLEEISRIEGVPLGTVKSRISRAKEKLRSCFPRESE
jgi:RNA polymerase sigma-70 factor, ECF subfamily